MMNDFDITDLENAVRNTIREIGLSKNVYTSRPKSTGANLADFVVVKVSGGVSDKHAIGQTRVSVHLFAKNEDNFKNGKKLSVMYKRFVEGFPSEIGRYLFDPDEIRVVGDTPDGNGYHVRIIQLNKVIIKAA